MSPAPRSFARAFEWLIPCGIAAAIVVPARADSPRVVHVEEHWELRLSQPDQDRSAPQTTMVVSPDGDMDGVYFLFTLNHLSVPDYEPGGMQVQAWDGSQLLDDCVADEVGTHAQADEVVRWVQRLTLENDTLNFEVRNGESETWGDFGGDDLSLSTPTSLSSLNAYKPGISLTESQVSYAENRVVSLTLTKLVWITDEGEYNELSAPIAVDTSLDP